MNQDIAFGCFYESPDGRILRTTGWSGATRLVHYNFDDGQGTRTAQAAEYQAWKRREDLADFPNARDPRLPYDFDLLWGVNRRSQLVELLRNAEEAPTVREVMARHGIELTEAETAELDGVEEPAERAPFRTR